MKRGQLTDDEFALLLRLARRFADTDLDQFENLRFSSTYGPVFLHISRLPLGPLEAYVDVDHVIGEG